MLKKNNSINAHILRYFLIFSILILLFLWAFQVLFLKSFYRNEKTITIKKVANEIVNINNDEDFESLINDLSFENEVCIDITNNYTSLYETKFFGKGCMREQNIKEGIRNMLNGSSLHLDCQLCGLL